MAEREHIGILSWQESDIVIYVAGAEGGENADRPSMKLDQGDVDAIGAVLKEAKSKGKKTVAVLNVAGPVEMEEWLLYADAVLVNFVPGCMGGRATADVLTGAAVPGGKLPVTFPRKLSDAPTAPYPIGEHDDVYYSEGVFVGYRWYDFKEAEVSYPFGFGLSYTSFEVEAEALPKAWNIEKSRELELRVNVTNIGKMPGSEVVQLYLSMKNPRIPMPKKELKAFGKIHLAPGESGTVTLTLKKEDLEICDPERGILIPVGEYDLLLGTSSRDIFQESILEVRGKSPYVYDEHSTLGELLANPEAMGVLARYIPGMAQAISDMTPDMLKFMESEKIGPLLSRQMIRAISDTNQLKALLDEIFAQLAEIEIK